MRERHKAIKGDPPFFYGKKMKLANSWTIAGAFLENRAFLMARHLL